MICPVGKPDPLAALAEQRPVILKVFEIAAATQARKREAYASDADPFSNYERAAAHAGVPAYKYVEGRLAEKMERQASQMAKGIEEATDESQLEMAKDRINLAAIAYFLFLRHKLGREPTVEDVATE